MKMRTAIRFGPLLDHEVLRAAVEYEQDGYLWGRSCRITPRLVTEELGDGLGLIFIEPIFTRPNYYVVCVDSSWVTPDEWGHINVSDHIFDSEEVVLGAIESDFCNSEDEGDEGLSKEERERLRDFPAFHDGGYGFGPVYTEALLEAYARTHFGWPHPRLRFDAREAYRQAERARRTADRMAQGLALLTHREPAL